MRAKQNIILKTLRAKTLWTAWMTALIMWTLILTSVFITITYFIDTNILNEDVHMLGKTGVLFTISSVNFELKQGNEYRAEYILRIPRLSLSPSLSLSL